MLLPANEFLHYVLVDANLNCVFIDLIACPLKNFNLSTQIQEKHWGLLIATCLCSSKQDVIGSALKLTGTPAVGKNMLPIFQVVYTHNLTHIT